MIGGKPHLKIVDGWWRCTYLDFMSCGSTPCVAWARMRDIVVARTAVANELIDGLIKDASR